MLGTLQAASPGPRAFQVVGAPAPPAVQVHAVPLKAAGAASKAGGRPTLVTPAFGEKEFSVHLQKHSPEDKLGAQVEYDSDAIVIRALNPGGDGMLSKWNSANPSMMVLEGDRIVAVNDIRGKAQTKLKKALSKSNALHLIVQRGDKHPCRATPAAQAPPEHGAPPPPPCEEDPPAAPSALASSEKPVGVQKRLGQSPDDEALDVPTGLPIELPPQTPPQRSRKAAAQESSPRPPPTPPSRRDLGVDDEEKRGAAMQHGDQPSQGIYSVGQRVRYFSERKAKWIDCDVQKVNYDSQGQLLSYDLSLKQHAEPGKVRSASTSENAPPPMTPDKEQAKLDSKVRDHQEDKSGRNPVSLNVGDKVQYWSDTKRRWIETIVEAKHEQGGVVHFDLTCKKGVPADKVRAADNCYEVGEEVEYWSTSQKRWLSAKVLNIDGVQSGHVDLDIKPQAPLTRLQKARKADEVTVPSPRVLEVKLPAFVDSVPPPLSCGFKAGDQVQYYSEKKGRWIEAIVDAMSEKDGYVVYDLNVKKGTPADRVRPPAAAAAEESFKVGEAVEYFSSKQDKWIKARVLRVHTGTGQVDLDVKPGAQLSRLRRLASAEDAETPPLPRSFQLAAAASAVTSAATAAATSSSRSKQKTGARGADELAATEKGRKDKAADEDQEVDEETSIVGTDAGDPDAEDMLVKPPPPSARKAKTRACTEEDEEAEASRAEHQDKRARRGDENREKEADKEIEQHVGMEKHLSTKRIAPFPSDGEAVEAKDKASEFSVKRAALGQGMQLAGVLEDLHEEAEADAAVAASRKRRVEAERRRQERRHSDEVAGVSQADGQAPAVSVNKQIAATAPNPTAAVAGAGPKAIPPAVSELAASLLAPLPPLELGISAASLPPLPKLRLRLGSLYGSNGNADTCDSSPPAASSIAAAVAGSKASAPPGPARERQREADRSAERKRSRSRRRRR